MKNTLQMYDFYLKRQLLRTVFDCSLEFFNIIGAKCAKNMMVNTKKENNNDENKEKL